MANKKGDIDAAAIPKPITEMTLDEVVAALYEVNALVDEAKEQARQLTAHRDKLIAQQKAKDLLDGMSEAERAALVQHISVPSVSTQE